MLRLAASDRLPAHLLIGSDAVRFAGEAEKTREAEAAQWRQMSLSTDVDSSTVLPDMRFLRYGLCAHGRGERTPGWNDSLKLGGLLQQAALEKSKKAKYDSPRYPHSQ